MDQSEKMEEKNQTELTFAKEMMKALEKAAASNFTEPRAKTTAEEKAKRAELRKMQLKKSEFMAMKKIREKIFKQFEEREAAKAAKEKNKNTAEKEDAGNSSGEEFERMMGKKIEVTKRLDAELEELEKQQAAVQNIQKYEEELNLCKTVELKTMLDAAKELKGLMGDGNMFDEIEAEPDDGEDEERDEEIRKLVRVHRENVQIANLVIKMITKGGLKGDYHFRSPGMLKVRSYVEGILNGSYDFDLAMNRMMDKKDKK